MRIPIFPNSLLSPFIVTSPQTPYYNCIAWAFGDDTKWYWPDPDEMYFWPTNIPRTVEVSSFVELYRLIGYDVCESSDFEEGYEKIAIFSNDLGLPTHAARQLQNGYWTSKLGCEHDIQHTIESMNNGAYGNATIFMKRIFT